MKNRLFYKTTTTTHGPCQRRFWMGRRWDFPFQPPHSRCSHQNLFCFSPAEKETVMLTDYDCEYSNTPLQIFDPFKLMMIKKVMSLLLDTYKDWTQQITDPPSSLKNKQMICSCSRWAKLHVLGISSKIFICLFCFECDQSMCYIWNRW